MNVRSWGNLVPSIVKAGLLGTLKLRINLADSKKIIMYLKMKLMRSFCRSKQISMKDEAHENINSEVDEDELYRLDKMSLDEK